MFFGKFLRFFILLVSLGLPTLQTRVVSEQEVWDKVLPAVKSLEKNPFITRAVLTAAINLGARALATDCVKMEANPLDAERILNSVQAASQLLTTFFIRFMGTPISELLSSKKLFSLQMAARLEFLEKILTKDSGFLQEHPRFKLNLQLHKAADNYAFITRALATLASYEGLEAIPQLCWASKEEVLPILGIEALRLFILFKYFQRLCEKSSVTIDLSSCVVSRDAKILTAQAINSAESVVNCCGVENEKMLLKEALENPTNLSGLEEKILQWIPFKISVLSTFLSGTRFVVPLLVKLLFAKKSFTKIIKDLPQEKASIFISALFDLFVFSLQFKNIFYQQHSPVFEKFKVLQSCLEDILEPSKIDDIPGALPINPSNYDIELEDLHYELDRKGEQAFVFDYNGKIEIPQGSRVAIVGTTGSGKSTLVDHIMQRYERVPNQIKIGGQDIALCQANSVRALIAYVDQKLTMTTLRTLRDVIKGQHLDATDAEVIEAAKKACIHDFIYSLPQGYDTLIGDLGIGLSGGQKQRLLIARAILQVLRGAMILILDEATSQLDSATEQRVHQNLLKLSQDVTIIIVAHRYSSIMGVDSVIVCNQGTIAEYGGFRELLSDKTSLFRKLFTAQMEDVKKQFDFLK